MPTSSRRMSRGLLINIGRTAREFIPTIPFIACNDDNEAGVGRARWWKQGGGRLTAADFLCARARHRSSRTHLHRGSPLHYLHHYIRSSPRRPTESPTPRLHPRPRPALASVRTQSPSRSQRLLGLLHGRRRGRPKREPRLERVRAHAAHPREAPRVRVFIIVSGASVFVPQQRRIRVGVLVLVERLVSSVFRRVVHGGVDGGVPHHQVVRVPRILHFLVGCESFLRPPNDENPRTLRPLPFAVVRPRRRCRRFSCAGVRAGVGVLRTHARGAARGSSDNTRITRPLPIAAVSVLSHAPAAAGAGAGAPEGTLARMPTNPFMWAARYSWPRQWDARRTNPLLRCAVAFGVLGDGMRMVGENVVVLLAGAGLRAVRKADLALRVHSGEGRRRAGAAPTHPSRLKGRTRARWGRGRRGGGWRMRVCACAVSAGAGAGPRRGAGAAHAKAAGNSARTVESGRSPFNGAARGVRAGRGAGDAPIALEAVHGRGIRPDGCISRRLRAEGALWAWNDSMRPTLAARGDTAVGDWREGVADGQQGLVSRRLRPEDGALGGGQRCDAGGKDSKCGLGWVSGSLENGGVSCEESKERERSETRKPEVGARGCAGAVAVEHDRVVFAGPDSGRGHWLDSRVLLQLQLGEVLAHPRISSTIVDPRNFAALQSELPSSRKAIFHDSRININGEQGRACNAFNGEARRAVVRALAKANESAPADATPWLIFAQTRDPLSAQSKALRSPLCMPTEYGRPGRRFKGPIPFWTTFGTV
ncbi:hypothetical protein DFH09DRAFT_1281500 [Mycena vulgaris]|nr:hypothetical protein DFH09DRAFT_1281500 [Mycena vulgaris]